MDFGMPTLIEPNETIQNTVSTIKNNKLAGFASKPIVMNKNIYDNIALCKKLGLNFLELNMNLPEYQIEYLENIDFFKQIANTANIYYTIHLDENLNIADFNQSVAKAYTETVIRTIKIAKLLKVPVLNMHMNHGVHFTLPNKKVQLFEKYFDNYIKNFEVFKYLCETEIGTSNIKICIENTNGFPSYEKAAIELLLKSNVFTLTWDIGHSHSCANIDESFLMKQKHKLHHFHIHDSAKTKDHMTLGTGEIDLKQRLKLAKKYNCRCVIETKTAQSLEESVLWLKNTGFIPY